MSDQLRPRRTWASNKVFQLPGGNEDSDLWVRDDGEKLTSTFVPTDEQRNRIAAGANIDLVIWSRQQPPVALVLDEIAQLGKIPESTEIMLERSPLVTAEGTVWVWLRHAGDQEAALRAVHGLTDIDPHDLVCSAEPVALVRVEGAQWTPGDFDNPAAELFWQVERKDAS